MMWGLVPPWHHGSVASSHRLTTNNARLEGLGESKLYKPAIEHDRRCVVVCDAFYEWKKLKDAGTGKVFQSICFSWLFNVLCTLNRTTHKLSSVIVTLL